MRYFLSAAPQARLKEILSQVYEYLLLNCICSIVMFKNNSQAVNGLILQRGYIAENNTLTAKRRDTGQRHNRVS